MVGVAFNCAVLIHYKYPQQVFYALHGYLKGEEDLLAVVLPLELSFVFFHCVSYLVDIYRAKQKPGSREWQEFLNFSLYLLFFPKLVQGPIVPYGEMRRRSRGGQLRWIPSAREFSDSFSTLPKRCF